MVSREENNKVPVLFWGLKEINKGTLSEGCFKEVSCLPVISKNTFVSFHVFLGARKKQDERVSSSATHWDGRIKGAGAMDVCVLLAVQMDPLACLNVRQDIAVTEPRALCTSHTLTHTPSVDINWLSVVLLPRLQSTPRTHPKESSLSDFGLAWIGPPWDTSLYTHRSQCMCVCACKYGMKRCLERFIALASGLVKRVDSSHPHLPHPLLINVTCFVFSFQKAPEKN